MKGWRRTLHQSAAVWICKWYFWLLWDQQGRPVQRDARAGSGQEGKPKSRAGWVLWLNWDIVLCVCVSSVCFFCLFVCFQRRCQTGRESCRKNFGSTTCWLTAKPTMITGTRRSKRCWRRRVRVMSDTFRGALVISYIFGLPTALRGSMCSPDEELGSLHSCVFNSKCEEKMDVTKTMCLTLIEVYSIFFFFTLPDLLSGLKLIKIFSR